MYMEWMDNTPIFGKIKDVYIEIKGDKLMEEIDSYKNNIEKSMYVLKDIQHSLRETSIGYISIENIFDYIKFLESKMEEISCIIKIQEKMCKK